MGICRPGLRSYNTDTFPAKEKIKTKVAPRIASTEREVRRKSQGEGMCATREGVHLGGQDGRGRGLLTAECKGLGTA